MPDPTSDEYQEQIDLCRQRFEQVRKQILTVLHGDVEAFFPKAAKQAFLAAPEAADALSDDQVAELKVAAVKAGAACAEGLSAALSTPDAWTTVDHAPGSVDDPRSLAGVPQVWKQLQGVDDAVDALLSDYQLSSGRPAYRPPTYFVGGLYLPSLVEHLWKLLAELEALEAARTQADADSVRSRLESRWSDA